MKIFSSLRRLLVGLVVAAIAPLFVFSVIGSVANIDRDLAKAQQDLEFTSTAIAHGQQRVADSARQLLLSIASVPKLVDLDGGGCADYFTILGKNLQVYTNIGVISANGNLLCHAASTGVGEYVGDRDYFKAALARDAFAASGYLVGLVSKKPMVAFASPVKNAQGHTTAVAFAALDFHELTKAVGDIKLPPGSHLLIMDRAGVVLAENIQPSTTVGKLVTNPLLEKAIQSGAQGILKGPDANGTAKIYALSRTTPASDSAFFVAVGMDTDAVVGQARRELALELVVLLLVTALGGLMAWIVGGRLIMPPALDLLRATEQIQAGQLDFRISMALGGPDHELNRIAHGFNHMAGALQQREADLMLELQRSEQAWETLDQTINSLQDGLIVIDSAARILLTNEAAARVFGLDPGITPMSPEWPKLLGLFIPGTERLYALDDLPLYKALQGKSGGSQHILVRNHRVPEGRLITARYRPMTDGNGEVGGLMVFSDITDLDQLQQKQVKSYAALRESQGKLLDAQRLGRIGHWEMNRATHVISWSDELYELFGLARGGFDGQHATFLKMIHPKDIERYLQSSVEAIQRDAELDIEYRIITPSGQTRWMHQLGQTRFSQDGKSDYRVGVVQEITTRKQSELALARSTDLLQRTGEMALIGGWEISFDPLTTHWTDEMFRIHECDPGDGMSSRRAIRFFAPEAQPVLRKALRAAVEHGIPWDLELPLITAQGRRIWVRTQGEQVHVRGRLVGLSGALQDITSQHNALEQLRLLETCVSRLNDIVLITEAEPLNSPGPRIVFVNDAFERRTGYSREEVIGKSPRFLQGPKTQRAELVRIDAALKKRQPVRAELINYSKTGEEFWIELDIVPIANERGWFTHWVAVERDITQRKLAEQALIDSEQRHVALFETAPVPMWVVDTHTGRFLIVNSAASQAYGYSVEEMLSMTLDDVRPESERARLRKALAEVVPGSEREGAWLHCRKDGSVFPVSIFASSVQYGDKSLRFVIALDRTDQVKAEKEVQEYLFTLQRAADAAQAITWHQTLDGTLKEVADQARGVIGSDQAVVSLALDNDSSHFKTVVSLSEKYAPYCETAKATFGSGLCAMVSESNRAIRMTQAELESHPRWRSYGGHTDTPLIIRGWMAVPLVSLNGKNMGVLQLSGKYEGEFTKQDEYVAIELAQMASIAIKNVQLIEEVSQLNSGLEQKVAERTVALARQEALFRALAEQAPQVVWTINPQGAVTYFNRAWVDLVGGNLQDWEGTRWFDAMHPEDLPAIWANWKVAVANGAPYVGIRRVRAKNGSYHTMSYRASPVLDDHGEVSFWVGIDADITEVKAIEAALRLSNEELEAFSYSVSHDLRSPLNTIDGFSRLLSKQLGPEVRGKERHFLSRIQAGVAQMGKLIEDLLSLAQVSRMQLQNEAVDLSAICQRIAEESQSRYPDRDVAVHIENGLHGHGDSGLIRIVLENLLGNAWKFTSHLEHATIHVGQKADAAGLPVFFVTDNGAGFDMAYADKLFVAFQRLHQASEFPGTGIGLATVGRAIARHGGLLWADAAVGKGATFFFTLPR
jgi:PAS domain S-box-containing protein